MSKDILQIMQLHVFETEKLIWNFVLFNSFFSYLFLHYVKVIVKTFILLHEYA